MNYVPFPKTDLNTDDDLKKWQKISNKKQGDWTILKDFLAKHTELIVGRDSKPKCWYSEVYQYDDYALDVEHFRPKNSAKPLTPQKVDKIKKQFGALLHQWYQCGGYVVKIRDKITNFAFVYANN
jgi:hypothetical protein